MVVLNQHRTDPLIIECYFHRDGLQSIIIIRHEMQLYCFKRGNFIENETYNEEEYFRSSGSVRRYRNVEGDFGGQNGVEVQEAFVDISRVLLFNSNDNTCNARVNQDSIDIYWKYESEEFISEDLNMISGNLHFVVWGDMCMELRS
jgi:hypothetical protein